VSFALVRFTLVHSSRRGCWVWGRSHQCMPWDCPCPAGTT
jgi:hypothetical protein